MAENVLFFCHLKPNICTYVVVTRVLNETCGSPYAIRS